MPEPAEGAGAGIVYWVYGRALLGGGGSVAGGGGRNMVFRLICGDEVGGANATVGGGGRATEPAASDAGVSAARLLRGLAHKIAGAGAAVGGAGASWRRADPGEDAGLAKAAGAAGAGRRTAAGDELADWDAGAGGRGGAATGTGGTGKVGRREVLRSTISGLDNAGPKGRLIIGLNDG